MLKGIAASPGIEIGKVYVVKEQTITIDKQFIPAEKVGQEINRIDNAVKTSHGQLETIKETAEKELGQEKAEIFAAHLMVLDDAVFLRYRPLSDWIFIYGPFRITYDLNLEVGIMVEIFFAAIITDILAKEVTLLDDGVVVNNVVKEANG